MDGKRILLIISGGIAAYKCLDLIRRLRERGAVVRCILTKSAAHLVTPLSVAALSENRIYQDLFSLTDETEIGHIRLSREADLVVVAPATANILAKMAAGIADDLATTALLAADAPILVAPAMNVVMWEHPATRRNLALLIERGVHVVGPASGELACGETGAGRMEEPDAILAAIAALLTRGSSLAGRRALVTSGPTHEPIDPVRFLGNRSSGRQGHAIAAALAALGADTVLVSGPTALPDPPGVTVRRVETALEMLAACLAELPVDAAVCAAAVADWRVDSTRERKLKKAAGAALGREPRHRGRDRGRRRAATPRRRVRCRDRGRGRQRRRQAAGQGLRLDGRQRCRARVGRFGGRPQHGPPGDRGGRRVLADADQGRGGAAAGRADRRLARRPERRGGPVNGRVVIRGVARGTRTK